MRSVHGASDVLLSHWLRPIVGIGHLAFRFTSTLERAPSGFCVQTNLARTLHSRLLGVLEGWLPVSVFKLRSSHSHYCGYQRLLTDELELDAIKGEQCQSFTPRGRSPFLLQGEIRSVSHSLSFHCLTTPAFINALPDTLGTAHFPAPQTQRPTSPWLHWGATMVGRQKPLPRADILLSSQSCPTRVPKGRRTWI